MSTTTQKVLNEPRSTPSVTVSLKAPTTSDQQPVPPKSAIKPAKPTKTTTKTTSQQTDNDNLHSDCKRAETKLNKEISELKRALNDKTELIGQLREQQSQLAELKSNELAILKQRVENGQLTIESQQQEIKSLRTKQCKKYFKKLG